MKTLIGKELQENLKLAALGIIIFTLLLLQNYHFSSTALVDFASRPDDWGFAERSQPLLASGFLTQTSFFCAIFGAVLGWMQMFNERHRDLWAFLVHRPVTRTELFLGKAIAGVVLYLLVTGLPLICLWAWVQFPGHIAAPFEWRMVIPSLAFCLAGLVCYFAGMLTGLRQARWYASRGLGLAAAAVVCLAVRLGSSLWEPFLVVGVGMLVMTVAAWGAFQSSGHYEGQPARGRIALTISLTIGSAAVIIVALGLLTTFLSDNRYSWPYYSMDRDGVIYEITQRRGQPAEIVDLQGKPLIDEKTGRMIQMSDFNHRTSRSSSLNIDFGNPSPGMFAEPFRYFLLWRATPDTVWYFWSKYGRLIGYDMATRRIIGSIGPGGFSSDRAGSGSRFVRPYNHHAWSPANLLNTAETVYEADLENRAVRALFTTTSDDPVGGAIEVQVGKEETDRRYILAATRHFIHLISPGAKEAWKIRYQPAFPDYTTISFFSLESLNQSSVWLRPSYARNQGRSLKLPTHVMWLGSEGSIAKSIDLPGREVGGNNQFEERVAAFLMPPAIVALFPFFESGTLPFQKHWRIAIASLVCSAAIYLPLVFWFCRRYALSARSTWGWMVFLLFTGVPGLLAFFSLQEWPAREPCPSCNKLRVVTRETCEHCGLPFTKPLKVGIEIFEPA